MSTSNDSTITIDNDKALFSSEFLEFCDKVRNDDPSVLLELGEHFRSNELSEKEDIELADALLENTNVTYLQLKTQTYTERSAEAMAKYVRTSKRLQHIRWSRNRMADNRALKQREDMLCCFLPAIQESMSLKELQVDLPPIGGPSNLALKMC